MFTTGAIKRSTSSQSFDATNLTMTTPRTLIAPASLAVAAPTFLARSWTVAVGGVNRTHVQAPRCPVEAATTPCMIYEVTPIAAQQVREGFSAFDTLLADPEVAGDVAEGRAWIASRFGSGDLASLRLLAGLSQAELAQRCGLSQPHVSRYESGRIEPGIDVAKRLSNALGVTLDQFHAAWHLSSPANVELQANQ